MTNRGNARCRSRFRTRLEIFFLSFVEPQAAIKPLSCGETMAKLQ
jgi:hypothetical protein